MGTNVRTRKTEDEEINKMHDKFNQNQYCQNVNGNNHQATVLRNGP